MRSGWSTTPHLRARSGFAREIIKWALGRRLAVASSSARVAPDGRTACHWAPTMRCFPGVSAFYVHRILGGAKPTNLGIERPTIYKLSVNRRTAAALGRTTFAIVAASAQDQGDSVTTRRYLVLLIAVVSVHGSRRMPGCTSNPDDCRRSRSCQPGQPEDVVVVDNAGSGWGCFPEALRALG